MAEMRRVERREDIELVAALAREIWNGHFVPIIGQAQVDYMLDKFQSVHAVTGQIADGYEYYIVMSSGLPVGYFAIVPDMEASSAMLSKLYVREHKRRRGMGRAILAFVERRCAELGMRELWLTVNRHNAGPIAFYEHVGFTTAGALVQDIGNGFVMDDYRMVKGLDA